MSTLLLRLAAPLQAWGDESKFETRRTAREPTKSGVVGLLAAALGRRRDQGVEDLNRLRFGVRVDREGQLLVDFHIARSEKQNYVTYRHYLSDGIFLVGLESEDEAWLKQLEAALKEPVFPLYLGRRSCPPTLPLALGIRPCGLLEALRKEPCLLSQWMRKRTRGQIQMRLMADGDAANPRGAIQKDLAVSFHPGKRQYAYRPVVEYPSVFVKAEGIPSAEDDHHDPMAEL